MEKKEVEELKMEREEDVINRITAPEGKKYVGEFMETLPIGILNKKNTGCGATSLMIENEENVIICCPTKQLVRNKEEQYPNERCRYKVLGVLEGVSRKDIDDYIDDYQEKQPIKILVTYNSLVKVMDVLGEAIHGYKIIVDEFQEILSGAIYRDKTMIDFLQRVNQQRQVTYLSATPTPTEFLPEELIEVPKYEIEWGKNAEIIRPHRIATDSPFSYIARMIIEHKLGNKFQIKGKSVEDYFFFVNSVSAISSIVKQVGLTNDEVNVICADNAKNKTTLEDIEIGSIPKEGKPNKPFTFCTKSAFCGVDFFSKAGLTIIVSDGRHKSTMLDIFTDIRQIAGRIRNEDNLFRHAILHVFNTGYVLEKEDFEYELASNIADAEMDINAFETLKREGKGYEGSMIAKVRNDGTESFVIFDEQKYSMRINELKVKYSRWKFETIDEVYTNGLTMSQAYARDGFDLEEAIEWEQKLKEFIRVINKMPTFKVLYEEYFLVMNNKLEGFAVIPERAKEIEKINPLVVLAYQYLTPERVETLRYNVTDIKNEIHKNMPETKAALKAFVKEDFFTGEAYTKEHIKNLLSAKHHKLGIKAKAKATDILNYCEVVETKIPIGDGKRKDGWRITKILLLYFLMKKEVLQNS